MKLDIDSGLGRFGLKSYRPGQREVIQAVVSGKDVLCVMPTGGGKSLCYQLPSLLLEGVTLVVSPLIALMKDQEDQLCRLGIRATALHSGIEVREQQERLERIAGGEFDLVYVAPERFRSSRFLGMVKSMHVPLLAVDEAHCISEWGHDFRPDYARLGWFRQQLGSPPTIALTATATDIVRRDIVDQLGLRDAAVFIRGFDRPNLRYQVTAANTKAQKLNRLKTLLDSTAGSVIIYSSSRKNCDEVAAYVRERTKRKIVIYHAGMLPADRKSAQEAFMGGQVDTVVATNAFGMGIDKPDIRAVLHVNMPGTLEAYYQEAGRAGRDGQPAVCEILFSYADRMIQEYFIESEYPDAGTVGSVLEFLRRQEADPIELTRAEIAAGTGGQLSEMAIGSCLKLLETAGALERLRPRENMAIIRIHETGPDLADLVPSNATTLQKVLRCLDQIVGPRRGQDCYFHPDGTAQYLGMDRAALTRALREICERLRIEYVPPFRGNATRLLDRTTPLHQLPLNFAELAQRKRREYGKLDLVIDYAQNARCRRAILMDYFGDAAPVCGNCDNCQPVRSRAQPAATDRTRAANAAHVVDETIARVLRQALQAVAEVRGRFGKILIAQTLTGSRDKKVTRFGLSKRQCFGQLDGLRQTDVCALLDALMLTGHLQQEGDPRRPVLSLTTRGANVLNEQDRFPDHLPLEDEVWDRLRQAFGAPAPPPPRRNAVHASSQPPAGADDRAIQGDGKEPANRPSSYWTWRLLDKGFSVAECAAIRTMRPTTVLDHALLCLRSGFEVPLEPFKEHEFGPDDQPLLEELFQAAKTR